MPRKSISTPLPACTRLAGHGSIRSILQRTAELCTLPHISCCGSSSEVPLGASAICRSPLAPVDLPFQTDAAPSASGMHEDGIIFLRIHQGDPSPMRFDCESSVVSPMSASSLSATGSPATFDR